MSILKFSHPKLKYLEMNFGQLSQIVGDNNETKQQLWQNIVWYLNNHKYSEAELNILDNDIPIIWENNNIMSRNKFQPIVIESITDIHELLTVKKGTPIFNLLHEIMNNIEISQNIENINLELENITKKMNQDQKIKTLNVNQTIKWNIDTEEMNVQNLLQKNISIMPKHEDCSYAIEYLDGFSKYKLLIKLLDANLSINGNPILLMIKNIDDTLHYDEYERIMEMLEDLVKTHTHFHCMVFPSQIGYVYISEKYIENILIVGQQVCSLTDGELLYECVCKNYPSNTPPTYKEFIKYLKTITPYLFTNKKQGIQMTIKEMVLIKIINEAYQYYDYEAEKIDTYNQIEYDYIFK